MKGKTKKVEEQEIGSKKVEKLLYVVIGILGAMLVVSVLSMLLTAGTLSFGTNKNNTNTNTDNKTNTEEEPAADYDVSKFKSVDLAGLKNVVKDKTVQVVYIGRSTCGYCVEFLPIMLQAQTDYKFTTNYFDITQVINFTTGEVSDQDGYDYIIGLDDFMKENFGSTPMVAIFKNGKYVDGTVGYTDLATYSKFLEKNGFKK